MCPPVAGRTVAACLSEGEYLAIPDAGHFPFAEEPEVFRGAVRAFLDHVAAREDPAVAV